MRRRKITNQYAEENRWVFSFDFSEEECLKEPGSEFRITGPMYWKDLSPKVLRSQVQCIERISPQKSSDHRSNVSKGSLPKSPQITGPMSRKDLSPKVLRSQVQCLERISPQKSSDHRSNVSKGSLPKSPPITGPMSRKDLSPKFLRSQVHCIERISPQKSSDHRSSVSKGSLPKSPPITGPMSRKDLSPKVLRSQVQCLERISPQKSSDHRSNVSKGSLPKSPPTGILRTWKIQGSAKRVSRVRAEKATQRSMEELYRRQCGSGWEIFCIESGCWLVASGVCRGKKWCGQI